MLFREGLSLRGMGEVRRGLHPRSVQGQLVKVLGAALTPGSWCRVSLLCVWGPRLMGFVPTQDHVPSTQLKWPCTGSPPPPMWGLKLAEDRPRPGAHGTGPRVPRTRSLPGGCRVCLIWSILFLVRTGLSRRKWVESSWVHV